MLRKIITPIYLEQSDSYTVIRIIVVGMLFFPLETTDIKIYSFTFTT
jgi:hypothetical protein